MADVLRSLLLKNKIKDVKGKLLRDYLIYLTKNINWLKYDEKQDFFYPDSYRFKEIEAQKCKLIKLKYFYHWKFPPTFAEKSVREITLDNVVKELTAGKVFSKQTRRLKTLENRGFVSKIGKRYISTGFNVKVYQDLDDTEIGYITRIRIVNVLNEELIVKLRVRVNEWQDKLFLVEDSVKFRTVIRRLYAGRKAKVLDRKELRDALLLHLFNEFSIKPFESKCLSLFSVVSEPSLQTLYDVCSLTIVGSGFKEVVPLVV